MDPFTQVMGPLILGGAILLIAWRWANEPRYEPPHWPKGYPAIAPSTNRQPKFPYRSFYDEWLGRGQYEDWPNLNYPSWLAKNDLLAYMPKGYMLRADGQWSWEPKD